MHAEFRRDPRTLINRFSAKPCVLSVPAGRSLAQAGCENSGHAIETTIHPTGETKVLFSGNKPIRNSIPIIIGRYSTFRLKRMISVVMAV